METKTLKPGDDIEVQFISHDGVIWNPAKVDYVNEDFVGVIYPSGRRQAVRWDQWSFPKTTRPADVEHQPSPDKITRG